VLPGAIRRCVIDGVARHLHGWKSGSWRASGRPTSARTALSSICFGVIDLGAQAEVPSARRSATPELTARYSHRRLHDLAGAVGRLPSYLPAADSKTAAAAPADVRPPAPGGPGVCVVCAAPGDLARVAGAWPGLPTHIRAAVLALVDAAGR
jgi:hypothetical protein